jgi:hypothetical protein
MDSRREIASGIAALEGYLLSQAEIRNARHEAEAFAERLPWLTSAERAELVRLYAEERLDISRRVLRRITERCRELRGEYAARYVRLRRRLLCVCVVLVLGAFTLCVCVLLAATASVRA